MPIETGGPGEEGHKKANLEMLLQPGERLAIRTEGLTIKKFRFTGCITDRRLILLDSRISDMPVAAKEIPRDAITRCERDALSTPDPVLILSIRTSDDDIRTMKIAFPGDGKSREKEASEWLRILNERSPGASQVNLEIEQFRPPISPAGLITSRQRAAPLFPEVERVRTAPRIPIEEQARIPSEQRAGDTRQAILPRREGSGTKDSADVPLFCYHCGKRIPPMANFCPYCGTRMNLIHLPTGSAEASVPKIPPPPPSAPRETHAGDPQFEDRSSSIRRFLHRGSGP